MRNRFIRLIDLLILAFTDIVIFHLAIMLALLLRFDFSIPEQYLTLYKQHSYIFTFFNLIPFYFTGMYKPVWQYASIKEIPTIFTSTVVLVFIDYVLHKPIGNRFPYSIYLLYGILVFILTTLVRYSFRIVNEWKIIRSYKQNPRKNLLIIGAGHAGHLVIKELLNNPGTNYHIIGLVDDDIKKTGKEIAGFPVLGRIKDIPKLVVKHKIQEIIFAIPSAGYKRQREILNYCKETGCKIKSLPSLQEIIDGKIDIKKIRDVEIEDLLGRQEIKLDLSKIGGYLTEKVVLVTGAGGSIGSEICRQVIKFKPKLLLLLDIYENTLYELLEDLKIHKDEVNFKPLIASIRDKKRIDEIFNTYRPQVVFHAAAHKHVPLMEENIIEAIKNNVIGTLNVAENADKYKAEKFVLISTDKAVNPANIMGASKRIAELIIQKLDRESQTEYAAVRFGNVLGSNGSVIPLFKKQIQKGGPVTVTHPDASRYFMTIPEAVQLVLQAGALAKGGEIFVLDMGEPVNILDLAIDLIKLSGLEPGKDIEIVYTGLRPGEKLTEELSLAEEGMDNTVHEKIFVARPVKIDWEKLEENIELLRNLTLLGNEQAVIEVIKEIVPNFRYGNYEEGKKVIGSGI